MNMLATLTSDSDIADERDSLGGSRLLESGLYGLKVVWAYLQKADSGALALVVNLKSADGKQELRQSFWMTGGTAKGCKNYYEKDGQKNYLPGFIMANALCLLTVGKEISQLATETKVIPVYNKEAKAEVPTKVEMLTDLLGQEILAGVIKQTVDKTKKNEATGAYEPTGETREENEVDKFFRAKDRMTTAEIRAQAAEPAFAAAWEDKWKGKTRDKTSKVSGTQAGVAGLPGAKAAGISKAAGTAKPATSLFG